MKIYEQHTNWCSPYSIKYFNDKIEIIFDFIHRNEPYKKFTIYSDINQWDWTAYLDFSVVELYEERLKKEHCNTLYINKVDWMWILLIIWSIKIFIPAYHSYNYYTSDFTLVIEYEKYEKWVLEEEKVNRIDLWYIN